MAAAHAGLSCLPLCCVVCTVACSKEELLEAKNTAFKAMVDMLLPKRNIASPSAQLRFHAGHVLFHARQNGLVPVLLLHCETLYKANQSYVTNSASPAMGAVPLPLGGLRHLLPPALAVLVAAGLLTHLPAASR